MVTLNLSNELRKLSTSHRDQLMVAFEQETTHTVEVRPGVFIGVNVAP